MNYSDEGKGVGRVLHEMEVIERYLNCMFFIYLMFACIFLQPYVLYRCTHKSVTSTYRGTQFLILQNLSKLLRAEKKYRDSKGKQLHGYSLGEIQN